MRGNVLLVVVISVRIDYGAGHIKVEGLAGENALKDLYIRIRV